jgi:hypothetical protein
MAAGLGFKTFTTGEVLTAADTNGYLMQGVLVFADAAARTAAITSPEEGQMSYLKDTNSTEYYSGSAWIAVSAGAASYTLLNAGGTSLTGSNTVTISGISNQDKIFVLITGASSTMANTYINLRINGDTASNYRFIGWQVPYASGSNNILSSDATDSAWPLAYQSAVANTGGGGITIQGCKSSGVKVITSVGNTNGTSAEIYNVQGYWNNSASITSISAFITPGNFDAGTIFVYGSSN